MRYVGQSFELAVEMDAVTLADTTGERLRHKFHELYTQIYGYADQEAELEVLDVRASVIGVNPKAPLARLERRGNLPSPGERDIFFEGRTCRAKVFSREELPVGCTFNGPAIVEQYDTTVFVTPGFRVKVDPYGNLIGEAVNGN